MKLIKTFGEFHAAAEQLLAELEVRGASNTAKVEPVVREILTGIRERGDEALREYTEKFDHIAGPLRVTTEEMQQAWNETTPALQAAMRLAQANIR